MSAPSPPPPPPVIPPTENEHDEHDENNAEASAELSSDGVMNHRSEEERVTETQKNERVKKQLQVMKIQLYQCNSGFGVSFFFKNLIEITVCQGNSLFYHLLGLLLIYEPISFIHS